jgi:hypothetical protein
VLISISGDAASFIMATPFGSSAPFAEPLWYSRNNSPYYKDSHRTLRAYVRDYIENDLKPYAEKCEAEGVVPRKVWTLILGRNLPAS